MSSKLKGTITRVSNGSIEFTPENSFDLQKLQPGLVCEVTIDVIANEQERRAAPVRTVPEATSGGLSAQPTETAKGGTR